MSAVEATALALPDGVLRMLALVHVCGHSLEIPQDCEGFPALAAEICRRFELDADAAAAMTSVSVAVPYDVMLRPPAEGGE